MRLAAKLSLLLAGATTLPMVLVLLLVVPSNTRALRSQLAQLYSQDARSLALECQRSVMDDLEALSLSARTDDFPNLGPPLAASLASATARPPTKPRAASAFIAWNAPASGNTSSRRCPKTSRNSICLPPCGASGRPDRRRCC